MRFSHDSRKPTESTQYLVNLFIRKICRTNEESSGDGLGLRSLLAWSLLLSVAATSLSFLVTLKQRPLCLHTDPSTSSTAAYTLKDAVTAVASNKLDQVTAEELEKVLYDESAFMERGKLAN